MAGRMEGQYWRGNFKDEICLCGKIKKGRRIRIGCQYKAGRERLIPYQFRSPQPHNDNLHIL